MPAADKVLQNMTDAAAAPVQAPDGTKACPSGRIRIGVFFDGTGNNMLRDWGNGTVPHPQLLTTDELKTQGNGPDPSKTGDQNAGKNHDAFKENGPTNVAKLYRLFIPQEPIQKAIYHHGVGTDSFAQNPKHDPNADDIHQPAADAMPDQLGEKGGAGGKGRVQWGLNQLAIFFSQNNNPLAREKLIDTYGFSRGAAIGRDFINTVDSQGIDNLTRENGKKYRVIGFGEMAQVVEETAYHRHDPNTVIHEFLGAFDTVASFGLGGAEIGNILAGYDFYVNHKKVRRAVHMMAEDERRLLFPVSSLFVDPKEWFAQDRYKFKGVMQEVWYPGVHSDVGGSYLWRPGTPGKPATPRTYSIRGNVYHVTDPPVEPGPAKMPELAHIPLHDMHASSLKAQVPLRALPDDDLHKIPGPLADLYAKYCAYREGRRYDNGQTYIHNLSHTEFVTCFYLMRELNGAYQPLRDGYIHNENMFFDVPHLQRRVLYMAPQPES